MAGVRVKDLPNKCTEKEIRIHFSKPENGGGTIKEIYFPLFKGQAVVMFENSVTVDTVIANEDHYIMGAEILVERLHLPQAFTTMEAKFDTSVAALLQATEDVRDTIQYYKNIEFCYDETGCITGVRGNWYTLEWVWAYIKRISSSQTYNRHQGYQAMSRELVESGSTSPMELDNPLISMPSATDETTDLKDQITSSGKTLEDGAKTKVKKKAPEQRTRAGHDSESTEVQHKRSIKDKTDKKEHLDDDKNLERLTALTISEPGRNMNDITIISSNADDIRSLDFRYGPLTVSVYTGMITMAETDAIVNAANGSLAHYGGVADAIAKAAGPEMQRQCDEYVSKSCRIPTTGVMHTCAGGEINQKVKYILHAVGPMYSSALHEKCALELTQTFLNCIKYGNDVLKIQSLAMPVISSGIFGCPLEECVSSFMNAVLLFAFEHMSDSVHLKEIHLVNNSENKTALTVLQLRDRIALGTQRLVLEAQQQIQHKNIEEFDFTSSRAAKKVDGQKLELDQLPAHGVANLPAERDQRSNLLLRNRFTGGEYGSSFGLPSSSSIHTGTSSALYHRNPSTSEMRGSGEATGYEAQRFETDYRSSNTRSGHVNDIGYFKQDANQEKIATSNATRKDYSSGLTFDSSKSSSGKYDSLKSSRNSATNFSSSVDRRVGTESPDTRDIGNRRSGPPVTSLLYSQENRFSGRTVGASRGHSPIETPGSAPRTVGRPLPPVPTNELRARKN